MKVKKKVLKGFSKLKVWLKRPKNKYRVVVGFAVAVIMLDLVVITLHVQSDRRRQAFINSQMSALGSRNVPSSKKPSPKEVATYQVAPNLPKYLVIPALNINARITKIYANAQNQIEAPGDIYDTGWYTSSSLPGQPGTMFIDGHVSSWTANGVFYNLKKLQTGNIIQIVRGDNKVFTYTVSKLQTYDASNVDMNQVLSPVDPNTPGISLMTCTGTVKSGTSEFTERLVVYGVLKS